MAQWCRRRRSGIESSKLLIGARAGLSATGDGYVAGLVGVCGDVECPLLISGQVQLISRRMQFAQRGRASLHCKDQLVFLCEDTHPIGIEQGTSSFTILLRTSQGD